MPESLAALGSTQQSRGARCCERLASFTRAATTTAYGWQAVPNRTSVQVGADPAVTTAYDDANRPTSDSAGGAYASDDDGRLTVRPGQRLTWDGLGRLTSVLPPSGNTPLASYTYDPLDRLVLVDDGGSTRTRFRYVGRTTAVAQTVDDPSGAVIRSIANDWAGGRLVDWTGSGADQRFYGTNGHHDVTWTADSTGAVSATLRYDPWGNLTSSTGSSLPDFRFQGSWSDATTGLSWLVTRWYAPSLGRFVSEDSLLGEPSDPLSRHLYAYGQGEPVGRLDPDGRFWYRWRYGDTLSSVAIRWLGSSSRRQAIINTNRNRLSTSDATSFPAGRCVWMPRELWFDEIWQKVPNQCTPTTKLITGDIFGARDATTIAAARKQLGDATNWYLLTSSSLYALTQRATQRSRSPYTALSTYRSNESWGNYLAVTWGNARALWTKRVSNPTTGIIFVKGSWLPPAGNRAATLGRYVFLDEDISYSYIGCCGLQLVAHEYIHVLQWQGRGDEFGRDYVKHWFAGTGPTNPLEAPAFIWGAWMKYYHRYGEAPPWSVFRPLPR